MEANNTEEYDPNKQNFGSIPPPPPADSSDSTTSVQQIQDRTVLVKGLPLNATEREIVIFFRRDTGYERSYFKINGGKKIALAIFSGREFAELAAKNNRSSIFYNVAVSVELLVPPKPGQVGEKRKREENELLSSIPDITKKQKLDHGVGSPPPFSSTLTIPKETPPKPSTVPYNLQYQNVKPPTTTPTNPLLTAQLQQTQSGMLGQGMTSSMATNPLMMNTGLAYQQNPYYNPAVQYGQSYNPYHGYRGGYRGRGRGRGRGYYRGRGRGRGGYRKRLSNDKIPRATLWVGNIPEGETNEELAKHIASQNCPGLRQVKIMTDGRGIGFLMFDTVEQATTAREILHDSFYKNMVFKVDYARRDMRKMEDSEM